MPGINRFLGAVYRELKTPAVIIAVAITLVAALGGWLLVQNAYTVMRGDAVAYWDMAQVPIDPSDIWTWDGVPDSNVPYTYRILTPFLVRNLFNASMEGFIFIAIVSLLICNYLIFKIARLYTPDAFTGSLLVIIFSTNFTIFNPLVNSALVDLPSFVCMLLITYIFLKHIIQKESTGAVIWILYAAILVVAALIKEWIFFVLPVLFLYLLYVRQPGKAASLFFCSLPGVVTHLIMRVIMGFFTDIQTISLALLLERYFTTFGAYRSLFATFGAAWILLPPALVSAYRHNRANNELYITVVLALLVGIFMCTIASDHNRYLFFLCFPFLIPSLSLYLSRYSARLRKGALYTLAIVLLLARLAMHYRPDWQEGFAPTAGQSETTLILITAAAAVQILVVLYYVVAVHCRKGLPGVVAPGAI
ncbi:hypothetical protein ACFLTZ_06960 [Chloroflexota bacterium]